MSDESTQDKELLERYRRASNTEAAAPSEAVRAAILAESRRVAEQRAKETRGQAFDASRPAANDPRWKITAFGTVGAALVAALLFAPRLWEGAPPVPSAGNAPVAVSADKAASSEASAAQSPKPESSPASSNFSKPLQEIVITQAKRESPQSGGAALPKLSAPAPERQRADRLQRDEALAQSAAPEEKVYSANDAKTAVQATPPPVTSPAAPPALNSPPAPIAPPGSSLIGGYAGRSPSKPAALLSAAASGDVVQTTALLDQGAALEARDELGRTPLMLAVMQRKPEVVRLLLDRGADPNVADNKGRTPLQQAKQENLREIAALLERAGAR